MISEPHNRSNEQVLPQHEGQPLHVEETRHEEELQNQLNHQRQSSSRKNNYLVEIQDPEGNVRTRKLTVKSTWQLHRGHRVIVSFNDATGQPILEGGDLFNKFLSDAAKLWTYFPVDARSWNKVDEKNKETVWCSMVMPKFKMNGVNMKTAKKYAFKKMNEGWKSKKNRLYSRMEGDGSKTLDELISNVPPGVRRESWENFVRYRRSAAGRAAVQRCKESRSKQAINHTTGKKSLSVRYSEMEVEANEEGRQATYLDLYKVTHRHKDGRAISESAERQIQWIEQLSQLEESQGSADPFAAIRASFDKPDHPGRVRGLGLGALPSRIFGKTCGSETGTSQSRKSSFSAQDAVLQEREAAHQERIAVLQEREAAHQERMAAHLERMAAHQKRMAALEEREDRIAEQEERLIQQQSEVMQMLKEMINRDEERRKKEAEWYNFMSAMNAFVQQQNPRAPPGFQHIPPVAPTNQRSMNMLPPPSQDDEGTVDSRGHVSDSREDESDD